MNKLLLLFSVLMLVYISCSGEEESPCGPNGVERPSSDGCSCDLYYEGEFCETEIREKYLGRWIGYQFSCAWGDTLPDGFVVDILRTSDISHVEIQSSNLLIRDTLIATVDNLGTIRHRKLEIVGNRIIQSYSLDVYDFKAAEELEVIIDRNEDLDEFSEFCGFILRRE